MTVGIGVTAQQVSEEALGKLLASADQDGATMMGRGFARELVYDLRAARAGLAARDAEIERLRSKYSVVVEDRAEEVRAHERALARVAQLEAAAREVVTHVQVATCECVDVPRSDCCTCGAHEHARAIANLDRVLDGAGL
jgi:phage terminase Nu1 subunit (DNA packaging protein)